MKQNIKATESTDIWIGVLIFKIQVAWCMSEVNSSVVCNQQLGSRQHHHEEVTLQCSPPTLHPLTHCHWTTWMCCLAWSWLSIFTRLSYGLDVLSSPDYSLVSWSGVKILIEVDVDGVNWSEYQSWWAALTLSSWHLFAQQSQLPVSHVWQHSFM